MIKEWFGQKELLELLIYNKETGIFTWRKAQGRCPQGATAGWLDKYGYLNIGLFTLNHQAHRLAWLYVYGEWPKWQVDHKNMIITDNRIDNLRIATMTNQRANQKVRGDSATGIKGVSLTRNGTYSAKISCNYVQEHLGTYSTAQEAHAAYVKRANELFGEFARAS
jgi:HNH endonuclease